MKHKSNKHKHESDCSCNPFASDNENNQKTEQQECNTGDNTQNTNCDEYKEKYEQLNNQYIRLAADFDNFRKRQAQELENAIKYGSEETLKKMLEVLDNFDRAKQSLTDTEDANAVKEAFAVIEKQVVDTLEKLGLQYIDTNNASFNPNLHDAVMQTPTSEHSEEKIIQELQKGYKLFDKVLRPSMVNVAVSE